MTTARAGWAEIETTPPLGLPMGGRGPRFTPGRAVLDPLIAQATVLEDSGGNRTLWISVDLVGLSPVIAEPLRYDLSALTGIPIEAVILNYSHTHSGPMGGFEGYATPLPKPTELHAYDESLCRNIIHVALAAVENLQPVTVTEYRGASRVGINRRRKGPSGETGMGPDPGWSTQPGSVADRRFRAGTAATGAWFSATDVTQSLSTVTRGTASPPTFRVSAAIRFDLNSAQTCIVSSSRASQGTSDPVSWLIRSVADSVSRRPPTR